jgi:lactoylglutathione lyase
MRFLQLDHMALHVRDVAKSCEFYEKVLRLETIPRPAFDFPGAWFRLGETQELHLIGDRDAAVNSRQRGTHYALMVDDMDQWEQHFRDLGVEYLERRVRPDRAYQIYVADPDGYHIELCTPPNTAPEQS